jgi:LPS export ABC transporter protein LptC
MGQDGNILYRVTAAEAAQSLDDESIRMTDVHLIYEPASDIPWDMVADTGRIPPDGNIIQLEGRVLAVSRDGNESATTIRTSYLEVDPERRTANTEARVIVEFDKRKVNATGLQADLERNVIVEFDKRKVNATGLQADLERNKFKLLSNVNGKFFP